MKYFVKSVFFLIGFWLLLIAIFSLPTSDFYRSNDSAGAYSVGSSKINFMSVDNRNVLISYDLPYDKCLSDFNNNLLKNSDFSFNTGSKKFDNGENVTYGTYDICDNWQLALNSKKSVCSIIFDNSGIGISSFTSSNESEHYCYLKQDITSLYVVNTYYSFSCVVNDKYYYFDNIYSDFVTNDTSYSAFRLINDFDNDVGFFARFENHYGKLLFNFGFNKVDFNISIDYLKLEFGSKATPYYSASYINKLYANNGGTISDYCIWSMSPVSYIEYDFNSHTPSCDLYYIKNRASLTFDNSFYNLMSLFSETKSYTQIYLNDVVECWSDLSSFRFSDVSYLIEFFNFIVNFFKLILNVILLLISPILDISSYIFAFIYSGVSSWVYL